MKVKLLFHHFFTVNFKLYKCIEGKKGENQAVYRDTDQQIEKIIIVLQTYKIPVQQISGIVIKSVVELIQENSAIMGKGVAKTLWGFVNTMISQIPIIGIFWSMLIFISTACIYVIQFMNVITSKGAQGAINVARSVKQSGGGGEGVGEGGGEGGDEGGGEGGGEGGEVTGASLGEIKKLIEKFIKSMYRISDACTP